MKRRDFLTISALAPLVPIKSEGQLEEPNLRIKVKNVEYGISSGTAMPSMISFSIKGLEYLFNLKLSADGSLYVNNEHVVPEKRKGKISDRDYGDLEENIGFEDDIDFMSNPYLELKPSDLPSYEEVINHWKTIRPKFIERIPHGAWFSGHTSTTYIYPDGRHVECPAKNDPIKTVRGKPFDNRFHSDGCEYIEIHPLEQHYRHGRHDYYLEKRSVTIEDLKTIQELSAHQSEAVLKLLKFISSCERPYDAVEMLSKNPARSR